MTRSAHEEMPEVRRRFVAAPNRVVHYRVSGSGPPVVLLHNSPNSSAIHLPLIKELSRAFTVFAPDTPGNGHSDPLTGSVTVASLADALNEFVDAVGIQAAGFYGFHTGSKILLEFVARHSHRVLAVVLDGLSLAKRSEDSSFVTRYVRPFEIDDDGAYLAREWTRLRDSARWFPWFSRDPIDRFDVSGSVQTVEFRS